MGLMSRAELLRENESLRERLRELDANLARLKRSGASAPIEPTADLTLAKWLATVVLKKAPGRGGVFELDAEGRIRFAAGPLAQTLAGSGEIVATKWSEALVASDRAKWRQYLANLDETYIDKSLSLHIQAPTERLTVEIVGRRSPDRAGAVWLFVAESAGPRKSTEVLADSGEAITAKHWAGVFAHELNQPLAAALSSAQGCRGLLASRKLKPAELTDLLDGLIRRVQLAADIVRRLRMMAGSEPPRRVSVDVREIVRRSLELLQGTLDDHHVSVTLDFAADIPNVAVDAVQILQVTVNLVRNAIEAMSSLPAPRRQLTVRATYDDREATVAVVDRGVGMPIETIRRLFQPLASAKPTGMGLGLTICRQIVESHGGRIWVNLNSPNGCTFSFSLPLDSEEP